MELMVLTAVCALVGLGCLGGAAFSVLGGEDVGVERIFMLLVWVMFGAMFLSLAAWIAKQTRPRHDEKKTANEPATVGAGKSH